LAGGVDIAPAPEPPFFLDKERGWFWRESKLEPKKRAIVEPEARRPMPSTSTTPSESSTPELVPLSATWFRKHLERYRDQAIDDPSPENVAAYYYLQRVMLDKAHRFTDAARQVVMADPMLDENQRRPIATFAANETNRLAGVASEQALWTVAHKAGLLFFFRSDCPYCHLQAPLLALLEQRFGFQVYAVSLDGRPMPGDLYADFHIDRGQARLLGVVSTPALFLMKPPDEIAPLSQGALSLDELTGRILLAAHESGWIDDAVFEATRGQRLSPTLIPSPSAVPAEALNDPVELIHALQANSLVGSGSP
jgi:conjugal transfer pilus assembly protein TraF